MRNFQGIIFLWIRKYREIFKSALVYLELLKSQSYHHIEKSQLICIANQLIGSYMMAILAFNDIRELQTFLVKYRQLLSKWNISLSDSVQSIIALALRHICIKHCEKMSMIVSLEAHVKKVLALYNKLNWCN